MLIKSLIYLGSNILNAVIPLALLPILTRVLTVEEYGQVGLFQTLITAFASLVGLSAASAAGRKYFEDSISQREMASYIGAALQVMMASLFPIICLAYIFAEPISNWLAIPAWWVIGAAIVPGLNVVVQMRLVQWQIRGAAYRYGGFQISYSIMNFALSLMLVLALGLGGGGGRVIALVVAGLVLAGCALFLLRRDRLVRLCAWRPAALREILSYGLPLVPHAVGLFLLAYADRIVIGTRLGLEDAGMYIAAMQLVGGAGLIFDALNKAYVPWLFERLARNDMREKRQIVRYTYAWFGIIAVGIVFAFLIGPDLYILIAGRAYEEAGEIVGWLALGQGLSGMYLMVTNYVFYSRRTGILAITTMVSAAAGLAALLLLVEPFGLMGAALAFCLGMGVRFLCTWWAGNLRHPMPWLSALRPAEQPIVRQEEQ